ncbi:MAG: hypothetical protein ACLFRN_10505 [Halothece sp.]
MNLRFLTAEIPDGAPDDVVRTVVENCTTLKFMGLISFITILLLWQWAAQGYTSVILPSAIARS